MLFDSTNLCVCHNHQWTVSPIPQCHCGYRFLNPQLFYEVTHFLCQYPFFSWGCYSYKSWVSFLFSNYFDPGQLGLLWPYMKFLFYYCLICDDLHLPVFSPVSLGFSTDGLSSILLSHCSLGSATTSSGSTLDPSLLIIQKPRSLSTLVPKSMAQFFNSPFQIGLDDSRTQQGTWCCFSPSGNLVLFLIICNLTTAMTPSSYPPAPVGIFKDSVCCHCHCTRPWTICNLLMLLSCPS